MERVYFHRNYLYFDKEVVILNLFLLIFYKKNFYSLKIFLFAVISFLMMSCSVINGETHYINKGDEYLMKGEIDLAIKEYERILGESPRDQIAKSVYVNLANLYMKRDNLGKAENVIKIGLNNYPNDPELLILLMNVQFASGLKLEGIETYKEISLHNDRGLRYSIPRRILEEMIKSHNYNLEEQKKYYQELLHYNPNDTIVKERLAIIYMKNKEYKEAIREYEEILSKGTKYGYLYPDLISCYVFLEDYANALKYYRKAEEYGTFYSKEFIEELEKKAKEQKL